MARRLTPPTDFDRFLDVFLLRLSLGFLLVVVGLGYLVDPKAILRFNAFMRDTLFKDSYVLLNGKKIGTFLVLLGFILLALSYTTPIR
jgi:hypothetical protein